MELCAFRTTSPKALVKRLRWAFAVTLGAKSWQEDLSRRKRLLLGPCPPVAGRPGDTGLAGSEAFMASAAALLGGGQVTI